MEYQEERLMNSEDLELEMANYINEMAVRIHPPTALLCTNRVCRPSSKARTCPCRTVCKTSHIMGPSMVEQMMIQRRCANKHIERIHSPVGYSLREETLIDEDLPTFHQSMPGFNTPFGRLRLRSIRRKLVGALPQPMSRAVETCVLTSFI